ncbi:MAG: hypothetical protein WCT03_23630 [Candidatus Obscuribacterales bacterium]
MADDRTRCGPNRAEVSNKNHLPISGLVAAFLIAASAAPPSLGEAVVRGLPEQLRQFQRVPHKNLRFLADLMPGFVLAQRISDHAEVIVEIKNNKLVKEWVIEKAALAGSGGMMADCRRYWIADAKSKIVDPRDYLLIAFENVYLGLRNANGKIILAPIWHSIDIGADFHIVATKLDDIGSTCDLSIFDATGKLLATISDISPATGGFIEDDMVIIKAKNIKEENGKAGLVNTDGVLIYPTKLETCMISMGIAHACEIVDGKCYYLAIDRSGRVLCRSLDENEVYNAEKPLQTATLAARQNRLPLPHRHVDVQRIQSLAEADHSLNTEHFTPAAWALPGKPFEGGRSAMFAGFLRDHKIIGMTRLEIKKLLGKGAENVFKTPGTLSYSIVTHCEGGELFTFKFESDKVSSWCHTYWGIGGKPPVPEWKIGEPDLTVYPFRTDPIPDNE